MYADCVIPIAGFEIAKLILSGFVKSLFANSLIFAGMVAEVDIVSGDKTVLSYLLQPVKKIGNEAFRER